MPRRVFAMGDVCIDPLGKVVSVTDVDFVKYTVTTRRHNGSITIWSAETMLSYGALIMRPECRVYHRGARVHNGGAGAP